MCINCINLVSNTLLYFIKCKRPTIKLTIISNKSYVDYCIRFILILHLVFLLSFQTCYILGDKKAQIKTYINTTFKKHILKEFIYIPNFVKL